MEKLEKCLVCDSSKLETFIETQDWFLSNEKFTIVKCENCDFLFTNPRPEAVDLGKYYKSSEYISHSNNKKGFINSIYQTVRAYTLNKKFKLIQEFKKQGSILDIGCATGEFLNVFQKAKWNTYGIEPDSDARSLAISNFKLDVFSEEKLFDFAENSFDVITMWHVLEHVSLLNERVLEVFRLLKDDGFAFIALPNANSFDAKKYEKFWAAYDVPRHLYHFTSGTFNKLIEKHNFEIVEILPMKFDSFYVSMLSEKYMKGNSNVLSAFTTGIKSNLKAENNGEFSSLIYVVKKKI